MSFLMAFLYLTHLVDLASTGGERADVLGLYPQRFPQTLRLVGCPYRTSRPTFWCPVMFVGLQPPTTIDYRDIPGINEHQL
jgi:hypothetical protein